jgi:chromosome segregation ATPase
MGSIQLNERTTASEQSNVALSKMGKLLQQKESSTAEISKYKQKMNEALSTASELQYKLQQAKRELSLLTFKMEQEQTAKVESNLLSRIDEGTTTNKLATLEQELAEKTSAYTILQQQMNEETALLQSKLAAKDALLEAKDKMLVAFKSKLEKLQHKAKQVEEKHAAEITQIKEEWEETRDELKCAEAEVLRGRTRIQEVSTTRHDTTRHNTTRHDTTRHYHIRHSPPLSREKRAQYSIAIWTCCLKFRLSLVAVGIIAGRSIQHPKRNGQQINLGRSESSGYNGRGQTT